MALIWLYVSLFEAFVWSNLILWDLAAFMALDMFFRLNGIIDKAISAAPKSAASKKVQ